jgi:hypothetical protein
MFVYNGFRTLKYGIGFVHTEVRFSGILSHVLGEVSYLNLYRFKTMLKVTSPFYNVLMYFVLYGGYHAKPFRCIEPLARII